MKNLNLPYVLDSTWFDGFLSGIEADIQKHPNFKTLSYFVKKIGNAAIPFHAHDWLLKLNDKDLNRLTRCTETIDDNQYAYTILAYVSTAMRGKICALPIDEESPEVEKQKHDAYLERLILLIKVVNMERQGLAKYERIPFSDQDEPVRVRVDVRKIGL